MLALALRNLFRQRARTLITLATIVAGVTSLILSGGFVNDSLTQVRESTIHSQIGHAQIYRRGFFADVSRNPYTYLFAAGDDIMSPLRRDPRVDTISSRLLFAGLLSNSRGDVPIIGEGIEPRAEERIGSAIRILEGHGLGPLDTDGIVLGEGLARAMNLNPGDRVTLLLNTREGSLNTGEFTVTGIFRTFFRDYDARAVRISLPAAQDLVQERAITSLVVLLKATSQTESFVRDSQALLASHQLEIIPWDELADFYAKTAALYRREFAVLQVIIFILVLLGVSNSVALTLHERIAELGTMRALGVGRMKVFLQLSVEYMLLGVLGATLGAICGLAAGALISWIGIAMPPPPNSEAPFTARIEIDTWVVLLSVVAGSAATFLAVLWPAWKAVRFPIADALRQSL